MAPRGQPTRINQLIDAPTPDEPERRMTVADFIYERMESTGLRPELIARIAGVNRDTVEAWLRDGQKAIDKRERGELVSIHESRLADFITKCRAAHGTWTAQHLDTLAQLAAGGLIIGKIVEKVDPTQLDAQGRPLVLERKVEQSKALPSLEAVKLVLERLAKDDDGHRIFAPRLEVTGADGGPIEVDDRQARVDALLAEADAFVAGAATQAQVDGEKASESTDGVALQPGR